jgi:predicted DNA-binding transcriptional regulator YafY
MEGIMKLERLVGILMILLHERSITAKILAHRFSVSIRTIQRDIDILSVAGIPITSSIGPKGGYSLMDNYTLDKTFLRKNEMKLLTDLLGGLEKLISQVGFDRIKEKMHMLHEKEVGSSFESIRFDFMPWLPQHENKEKLAHILEAITNHRQIEIDYRDQKGNCTYRRIEPYQLVMKDYAWYVYGYCMERNGFRYFKVIRIQQLKILEEEYNPRDFVVEEPFADLKLIEIKLKFSLNAVGRVEDYFHVSDIIYLNDHILVQTQFPDDPWLYQLLLSFGKDVQVLEPVSIRKKIQEEALELIDLYT